MPLLSQVQDILKNSLIQVLWVEPMPHGLKIHVNATDDLVFYHIKPKDLDRFLEGKGSARIGVIVDHLAAADRKRLESAEVSYITDDEDIFFALPEKRIRVSSSDLYANAPGFGYAAAARKRPAPTDFISPYGLAILDVLFRLPENALVRHVPHSLCKAFDLNYARLCKMMASTGQKDLLAFKSAIRSIPLEWWKSALLYPRTHQRLTAFHRKARPYPIADPGIQPGLIPGPDAGQYWVVGSDLLKEVLRSPRVEGGSIMLAKLRDEDELKKQSILSHAPDYGEFPPASSSINFFRWIWDACHANKLLQAVALDRLEKRLANYE